MDKSIGQVAYESFHDFDPPRPWELLSNTGKMRWDFVAEQVAAHVHKLRIAEANSRSSGWDG